MALIHSRLRELFLATCDLPESEQNEFLDKQCSDDPELRRELVRLLQNDLSGGLFVEGETAAQVQFTFDTQVEDKLPQQIGEYRVKGILGQGGMGVVYLAEQQNPRRDVAIKVIRSGMVSQELLKRFELEAAVLGRLKHPGIANIYESDFFVDNLTGQKRPFLVMEYVEGGQLRDFIKEMGHRQRLELFIKICGAVSHAHQRGVIHRDLKPGNVMVKKDGQPSILDFGVARATEEEPVTPALQTRVGQLIGTLPYMSPEQVNGNSPDADTRSDVYALGLLAFELLTDELPYTVDGTDYLESVRVISEQQPVPLASIRRDFRGDLDTIILKALEKDPERRYQSTQEFADDIQRYLNDEPIEARRVGLLERNWRWCRRNKVLAALAASVLVLVLSVTVISLVSVVQLTYAAREIEEKNQIANRRLFDSYLDQAKLRQLSHRPGQRIKAIAALENASSLFPTLDWQPEDQASHLVQLRTDFIGSLSSFDLREVKSWPRPDGSDKFQFDSNYRRYAVTGMDGSIQIRSAIDNQLIHQLAESGSRSWIVEFSPQGSFFAAKIHDNFPDSFKGFRIWDLTTGEMIFENIEGIEFFGGLAFSHDDTKFANLNDDGNVQIFQLNRLKDPPIVLESDFRPHKFFFRPDGTEIACVGRSTNEIEFWNLKDQTNRLVNCTRPAYFVDWNSESDKIAVACDDGVIRIWNVDQYEKSPERLAGHTSHVVELDFNDTGEFLVSRAWDSTQRFWDVKRKTEIFRVDSPLIKYSRFGTRQNQLGFLHAERFGIWEFGFDKAFASLSNENAVLNIAIHPLAPLIASSTDKGMVLWNTETKAVITKLPIGFTKSALFSPDGSQMYSSGKGGVRVWPIEFDEGVNGQVRVGIPMVLLKDKDLITSATLLSRMLKEQHGLDHTRTPTIERLSLNRTGRWLSIDCGETIAVVMDLQGDNPLQAFFGHNAGYQNQLNYAEISPDGKWVITTTWGGNGAWVWEARTGVMAKKLFKRNCSAVPAFSPSGELLAVATKNDVTIWEVGTWKVQQRFEREVNDWMGTVAFSPDGRYLVSAYDRRALQLRDLRSGERLAIFRVGEGDNIAEAHFSPDGSTLAATCSDSIVLWDLDSIQKRLGAMGIAWSE